MRLSYEDSSPWQAYQQGRLLEQAQQFEHDHDDDNYSDYVEDASVHAVNRYQSGCAVASIYAN